VYIHILVPKRFKCDLKQKENLLLNPQIHVNDPLWTNAFDKTRASFLLFLTLRKRHADKSNLHKYNKM